MIDIVAIVNNKLTTYFPNTTTTDLMTALMVFIAVGLVVRFLRWPLIKGIEKVTKKTKNNYDDHLITVIKNLGVSFYVVVAFYFALQFLNLSAFLQNLTHKFILIAMAYYGSILLINFIELVIEDKLHENSNAEVKQDETFLRLLAAFSKWIILAIAVLFALSNFGINITSLVAGLGIGGIAVALALQNILTDIFSSFTIYFDKPFKIGDFVVLDNGDMGTVKAIGIKSTRIMTLHGHELVASNRELTQVRINNYKQMKRRRVVHTIGVTYDTNNKKLEKIPKMIEDILGPIEKATYDRCHFKQFGPSSLDFELVYYMDVADYYAYMDVQQDVNLQIKKAFEKEKIEFAFPTQTIHLAK